MLLDGRVHRVWSKIEFTWPRNSTEIDANLREQGLVGKRGEYPGIRRVHHARHIDHSCQAIGKYNPQLELWQSFNRGHAPRRAGCNLIR